MVVQLLFFLKTFAPGTSVWTSQANGCSHTPQCYSLGLAKTCHHRSVCSYIAPSPETELTRCSYKFLSKTEQKSNYWESSTVVQMFNLFLLPSSSAAFQMFQETVFSSFFLESTRPLLSSHYERRVWILGAGVLSFTEGWHAEHNGRLALGVWMDKIGGQRWKVRGPWGDPKSEPHPLISGETQDIWKFSFRLCLNLHL